MSITVKILATGRTLGDIREAIEAASDSIENENTTGFDTNEDGAYTFSVSGDGDALSDESISYQGLEDDDARAVIAEAAVCAASGTRVHQLDTAGRCAYCRKELALVART